MNHEPLTLQECVRSNMLTYFSDLGGTDPANLHDMLVKAVEKPLLEEIGRASCRERVYI